MGSQVKIRLLLGKAKTDHGHSHDDRLENGALNGFHYKSWIHSPSDHAPISDICNSVPPFVASLAF